jgi:hypothetical protein
MGRTTARSTSSQRVSGRACSETRRV